MREPATRLRRVMLRAAASCLLMLVGVEPARSELRVGAAVSLREPLQRIAQAFATARGTPPVALAFGATNLLAAQLRAGAPLDLLLCADEEIALALAAEGIAESPVAFASNRIVVIAARELSLPIRGPDDLARPEIRRIALPEPAVPVGRYASAWLRDRGLEARLADRMVRTEHARATLTVVDQGHADLAIVYATDARLARSARVVLEIPDDQQPRIAYAAARVRGARDIAQAEAFVRFLLDAGAQATLAGAGFGPPPAASAR